MTTGEIGDGWEGVKGLALALSAHASPRNSPRDNNNNNNIDADIGGNSTSETPVTREDNNGTVGTTDSAGVSGAVGGNRARSMFAQRLKASTSAPPSAPISTNQQPEG